MRRITDSSASLPLNPGFNQCLVHPGTSQPQKHHSERDWDRQCLHRACGMCPVVQLFCGDFATQDVAASGVGGIGSKVLWVLRGCTAWEGWGSPTPPQFCHLSLAKPSSGQAPGLAFLVFRRYSLAGLGIWEPAGNQPSFPCADVYVRVPLCVCVEILNT